MTDHTDAAEERQDQVPESVPAPDLRLPPATVDSEQRGDRVMEAPGPDDVPLAGLGPRSAREPVMSTTNGHRSADPTTVTAARPVVLLRYRPGITGHTAPPGEGISGETDPLVAAVSYQAWNWPITLRGHQIWLTLQPDTVALTIPVLLAAQVAGILSQRRCPPLTLIHPERPKHWVLLAGRHSEGALPWPTWVHRSTDVLPLPPTITACGPLTWVHPPRADALRQCREFEVFAALRTALRDLPT